MLKSAAVEFGVSAVSQSVGMGTYAPASSRDGQVGVQALGTTIAEAVTPLRPDGCPDVVSIHSLTDRLVDAGASALLVLTRLGEGDNLRRSDRMEVAASFVHAAAGRVPVVVALPQQGLGDTIVDTESLVNLRVDGVALTAPGTEYLASERREFLRAIAETAPGTLLLLDQRAVLAGGTAESRREVERLAAGTGVCAVVVDNGPASSLVLEVAGATPGSACTPAQVTALTNGVWELPVALADARRRQDCRRAQQLQGVMTRLMRFYAALSPSQRLGALKGALVQREVIDFADLADPRRDPDAQLHGLVLRRLATWATASPSPAIGWPSR